jgi:hypothetical protein
MPVQHWPALNCFAAAPRAVIYANLINSENLCILPCVPTPRARFHYNYFHYSTGGRTEKSLEFSLCAQLFDQADNLLCPRRQIASKSLLQNQNNSPQLLT